MVEPLESRTLLSTSWFVAPYGSDSNRGTITAPFKTIQRAANIAGPGDVVDIRAGTYHETVVPKHSGTSSAPITFQAYNNENVTVSGADRITNWSDYKGSVYSASMPFDLGEGDNQLFVDGRAINEARFPNTSLDLSHQTYAHVQSASVWGSGATIYDSSLNQPAGYWTGAIIHIAPGQAWVAETGVVTSSSPGKITISMQELDSYSAVKAGNAYYLTGKFQALDSSSEWYRDSSGKVYAAMPSSDNPANHDVEAKHRLYAFDVSGQHDITIQNINVFAATINSDAGSRDLHINHINAKYVSQFLKMDNGWSVPSNTGIILKGANSVLQNSTVAYSAGDGVYVKGANSLVTNNVIHDVDYNAGDMAAVRLMASGVTVSHNTIYNAGRDGILHSVSRSTITYNTIHDIGLQTTDLGGTYAVNVNGGGTEVAYNKIYNIHTGGYGGDGLFLDNNASGFNVHNNIVSNVDYALKLNFTARNNNIYNNTLDASIYSVFTNQKGDWDGTRLTNNVFLKKAIFNTGAQVSSNAYSMVSGKGAGSFTSGASFAASDPTIPVTPVPVTPVPVTPVPVTPTPGLPSGSRSARSIIQAEDYDAEKGVKGDNYSGVGYADGGDYVKYSNIDFGSGASLFKANIAALSSYRGTIEIHIDSPTGKLAGTLKPSATGRWYRYKAETTKVSIPKGVHDIYLVFKGGHGIANIDWFTFA